MERWLNCPRQHKRRHLYLVLDDWPRGYSIRKFDLFSGDHAQQLVPAGAERDGSIYTGSHRLPPAFFRIEAEHGGPLHFAGAFDSKILALQPVNPAATYYGNGVPGVTMYDVRSRSLMVGPRQWPVPVHPIYIPIGGRLFSLADGSLERLNPEPCDNDSDEDDSEDDVWAWRKLPELPFRSEHVTGYAVHSNGRTIFVSIGGCGAPATLSLDTAESAIRDGGCKWNQHGQWQLPFTGRAYFHSELEAWVGLSRDPTTIGHPCSCDVVPIDSEDASNQHCPTLKLTKEKLFSEVPAERHIGATLVYLGEGKFCLLECIYIQADEVTGPDGGKNEDCVHAVTGKEDRERFIRLTTFSLHYDKNGDLTTVNSRRLWYYSVPQEVTEPMLKYPVAFWM